MPKPGRNSLRSPPDRPRGLPFPAPPRDKAAVHSLPLFVRLDGRPVILLGDGDAADAKRRLIARAGGVPVAEEAEAQLAIVAIEEEAPALAAIARLKARGILVNAVDRPRHCDFTLPAIVDRDPVLIAIGTGGASAGLAKALRQRLEALLPAGLGALARGLFEARPAIRRQWPDATGRRHAIDAGLAPGGPIDPFGQPDIHAWLAAPSTERRERVFLALPSDPDDLTLRQARLLGEADRVYHRPDVPPAILDRVRADAVRIACEAPPSIPPEPGLTLDIARADPGDNPASR